MTWFRPWPHSARDGWDVVVEPDAAGWEHTGLYAADLAPGDLRRIIGGDRELLVVPLHGSVTVVGEDAEGHHEVVLAGRDSVLAGPTDVAYLPPGSRLTLTARTPARVAVCFAVARARRPEDDPPDTHPPFRHLPADEVPVEARGAGAASRQVRNFGVPGLLDAESIIACEVVTPAGNWSSWPPHKHDEDRPGEETRLEEIYYFEVRPTGHATPAHPGGGGEGTQRHTGTGFVAVGGVDLVTEVADRDVVLVPRGWHGPAMAPPGYDLYYLNVMAGPGAVRDWLIRDHPDHAWVRDAWPEQEFDPRLRDGGLT